MRLVRIVLLLLALIPAAFAFSPATSPSFDPRVAHIDLMPGLVRGGRPLLGPATLVGAWEIRGRHRDFGNYSALAVMPEGQMLGIGDKGGVLWFDRPDRPGPWHTRIDRSFGIDPVRKRPDSDAESIVLLPDGRLLEGFEGTRNMYLVSHDMRHRTRIPIPALAGWPVNQGPEAMARLGDGRILLVGESYARWMDRRRHPAFLFAHVPRPGESPARLWVDMPEGFRPTDLATLPDGRLLILGRKLTLAGFVSVIGLIDQREVAPDRAVPVREVLRLTDRRLTDNYEGMALTPERDGTLALWLISDSNLMVLLQRTLLLKLRIDPRALDYPPSSDRSAPNAAPAAPALASAPSSTGVP